jgi:hypothetical protein
MKSDGCVQSRQIPPLLTWQLRQFDAVLLLKLGGSCVNSMEVSCWNNARVNPLSTTLAEVVGV